MTTPQTYNELRRELRWYETAFPNGTFAEISLALTGHEPIPDVREAAQAALDGETDVDFDDTERNTLERSVRLLDALDDRQVEAFGLRRYRTRGEETPEDINRKGSESDNPWGFAAHAASITAEAQVSVYKLSEKMHAIVWNREYTGGGMVTVRVGMYGGGFDVAFTSDVDGYLQRNFYDEDWRRAAHFTDADPWVYDDPRVTA